MQSMWPMLEAMVVGQQSLANWSRCCRDMMQQRDSLFDVSHRIDHLARVFCHAMGLAKAEGAELRVLVPAAWLHDCVAVDKRSTDRAQASRLSSQYASDWLRAQGYPQQWLSGIRHAIQAHSFSAGITPTTLEAKVLQDADRLDSLGAVGIARVMMLGGKFGNDLYDLHDPRAERRPLRDQQYILDHFYTKLFTLADSMQTAAGRRVAEERTAYMHDFIKRFCCEAGINCTD